MAPMINVLWDLGAFATRVGTASGATSSLTSNPPLDLSTLPRTVGNVMVLAFRSESATHTGPTGWTNRGSLKYTANNDQLSIWSKVVGASEAASQPFVQSGSDRCAWNCFEYSGAHGDVSATLAEGLNPPSHTPVWGSDKTVWATASSVASSDNTLTAPTGYAGTTTGASTASVDPTRVRCSMAHRENEAVSEDPSTWSATGTYSLELSATIGIRPV